MIILEFLNIKNLNVSLQVGDAVYARSTMSQSGAFDLQAGDVNAASYIPTGQVEFIGILRKIEKPQVGTYYLFVEERAGYILSPNDFIMFSKFSQGDSGLIGYYAKANFTNNSTEKAELFAVSSEIIINSK